MKSNPKKSARNNPPHLSPVQRREVLKSLRDHASRVRRHADELDQIVRAMDAIDAGPSTRSLEDDPSASQQPAPAPQPQPQPQASWWTFLTQFYRTIVQWSSEGDNFITTLPPDAQEFMQPPEMRTVNDITEDSA